LPAGFDANFIKSGSVLCDPQYPINLVKKFQARILVYDVELPLVKGLPCMLYCFSHKVPCKISTLEATVDQAKNYEVIKQKPKFLKKGNMAIV
jgi:elongation factor 1 alpha-like protein